MGAKSGLWGPFLDLSRTFHSPYSSDPYRITNQESRPFPIVPKLQNGKQVERRHPVKNRTVAGLLAIVFSCYQIMQNHNYQQLKNIEEPRLIFVLSDACCTSKCQYFKLTILSFFRQILGKSLHQLPPLSLQCISVLNESRARLTSPRCLTSCYCHPGGSSSS